MTFFLRLEQSFQHFLKKEQYVPEWEAFFCCSSLNVSFAWIFSSRAASCALAVLLWKAWGFLSQHLRNDFEFRELMKFSMVSNKSCEYSAMLLQMHICNNPFLEITQFCHLFVVLKIMPENRRNNPIFSPKVTVNEVKLWCI